VAGFQQLALDPLVSPAVVLDGEPFGQRGDFPAGRRLSCSACFTGYTWISASTTMTEC
jgi:hypothetical protein